MKNSYNVTYNRVRKTKLVHIIIFPKKLVKINSFLREKGGRNKTGDNGNLNGWEVEMKDYLKVVESLKN